jgi:hypothetical protein
MEDTLVVEIYVLLYVYLDKADLTLFRVLGVVRYSLPIARAHPVTSR